MDILEFIRQLLHGMIRDKRTLYVLCPAGIGDFLICGGLCHALLKKKRKQNCVLIAQDKYANSGLNFVGVKEVVYIPETFAKLIRRYSYATRDYETDNYVYGHPQMKNTFEDWANVVWDEKLPLVSRYKQDVFGLPLDTEIIPPLIDPPTELQIQHLHRDYNLDKERTIILAPYSGTFPTFEESFWKKLAAELARKGYVLYTNVANSNEKVIPGTAPIVTTFSELLYIAEKVNCFIGLRSGIFDLLTLTNARLFCIELTVRHWFWNLRINYNHTNGRSFYLGISDKAAVDAFMQQNDLRSVDDIVFFNCFKGTDVFFDFDSLSEEILRTVG